MESLLRSVYGRAEAEYVIKKSRFIATVCEVKTEAEAAAFIESVRKHYWDARHNCRPSKSEPAVRSSAPATTANRRERQAAPFWKS